MKEKTIKDAIEEVTKLNWDPSELEQWELAVGEEVTIPYNSSLARGTILRTGPKRTQVKLQYDIISKEKIQGIVKVTLDTNMIFKHTIKQS